MRRIRGSSIRMRAERTVMRRKRRDASRGSPRSLAAQKRFLRMTACLGVILAQRLGVVLSAGKFDLAFDLGGNAIAGCGTISPGPNRLQNVTVAGESGALEYERAVYTPVGADDETDFYLLAMCRCGEQRIGRGQSLWRLNVFTSRARTDMQYVDELGGAGERSRHLAFALLQGCRSRAQGRRACGLRHGGHERGCQQRDEYRRPGATMHELCCLPVSGVARGLAVANSGPLRDGSMSLH